MLLNGGDCGMKAFLASVLLFCLFTVTCSCVDISAESAILYEPLSDTIIYAKNIDKRREIASTTKIMTSVVAIENGNTEDMVTVPKSCVGIEGTSMYLREGEKISLGDLLYGMMLRSGNDAAMTIAYHIGNGNVQKFVDMMNQKAYELGMKDTSFKNPNGLPAEGHYSTARDMAKLASYAMKKQMFKEIVSTKSKTVGGRSIANHNKLLRLYDGANGIKTGFTKAAGRCLVSSAERGGTELIAVTLKASDDWNDHIKLFNIGFSEYRFADIINTGDVISQVPVVGGEANSVSAVAAGSSAIFENNDKAGKIQKRIKIPHFLYAPICKGDIIGEIEYTLDGNVIESLEIASSDTVEILKEENFIEKLIRFFRRK